jgi:hypothetical protein
VEEEMRKCFAFFALLVAVQSIAVPQTGAGFIPGSGFVPDSKTAIAIGEAILAPIYGEQKIVAERPFSAQLDKGVWMTSGHLPEGNDGGVAQIKIRKSDAAVVFVSHGK